MPERTKSVEIVLPVDSPTAESAENPSVTVVDAVYVFENDTLKQSLTISRLTETQMDFTYTVENRSEQQKELIRGAAKYEHSEIGGIEIEEGEDGNSIAFIEYVCDNGHRLSIRIDLETRTVIRIYGTGNHPRCPIESVGTLKLIR